MLDLYEKVCEDPSARKRLFERVRRPMVRNIIERLANIDSKLTAEYILAEYGDEEISTEVERVGVTFARYNLMHGIIKRSGDRKVKWSGELLLFYLEALCIYRS